ncbi:MAG: hypothetical protein U9O87_03100 [Verrucomicrobiota bacterium]|nr:hypothetical protein [Verrucomicrobiota bacterium]
MIRRKKERKESCPVCGIRLSFSEELFGCEVNCPDCEALLAIPKNSEDVIIKVSADLGVKDSTGKVVGKRGKGRFFIIFLLLLIGSVYYWWQQPYIPLKKIGKSIEFILKENANGHLSSEQKYHYLWIEAESADKILPSFEIDEDSACSGGKFLHHREDTGSGWTNPPSGVGSAEYKLDIKKAEKYYLWARVRWESGCSNAFFVKVDGGETSLQNRAESKQKGAQNTLGKDGTLHTWHWYSNLGVRYYTNLGVRYYKEIF